jgi:hypothetical protein
MSTSEHQKAQREAAAETARPEYAPRHEEGLARVLAGLAYVEKRRHRAEEPASGSTPTGAAKSERAGTERQNP